MFTRRSLLAASAAASAVAPALLGARAGWAQDTPAIKPPSIVELTSRPQVISAALSPDGSRYAVLCQRRDGDKRMAFILLCVVGSDAKPEQVLLGDYDVFRLAWANNERLLFWIEFDTASNGKKTGLWVGDDYVEIPVRRLGSIGADGKGLVILFANRQVAMRRSFDLSDVVDFMPADPRRIMMKLWDIDSNVMSLHAVDVYTGEATLVERGVGQTFGWVVQNGLPILRYDMSGRGNVTVQVRPPGERDWSAYRKFRRDERLELEEFNVVAAAAEPGVVLVETRSGGEDTTRLRRFDVRTRAFGEAIAGKDGYDIHHTLVDDKGELIGVAYAEERLNYAFTDPSLAPHFRGLNTFAGKECNVALHDISLDRNRMIVRASGPREPGTFYIYDRTAKDLRTIGAEMPWLKADRLASMETLKVRTRDGAEITAYLSTPALPASGPRPLVVMPHGGPHNVRDTYDYDVFVQAMAARGWLVLQPNFRGSGGYGKAFEDQGRLHWDSRMQDDVEDAINQVVASGKADKARIAIWGASYGGYTALMQAVRRPDLYKAVVSLAGPSDLDEMLDYEREDGWDAPSYQFWVRSIGDPKKDGPAIAKASPARRAAEIASPVLLLHGGDDDVVPVKQSRIMAKAMKAAGKSCEIVEYPGIGHRLNEWTYTAWRDILRRSTDFIAQHI